MNKKTRTAIAALLIALPLFVSAQGNVANLGLSEKTTVGNVSSYNAQNIALISANNESTSHFSRGGGSVEIVDVSALKSSKGVNTEVNEPASTRAGSVSVYVVREGDSIGAIAQMFDVSTNTIIWANDLEGTTIQPGKSLIILPMSGVRHKVEEGDTIKSIAKKYSGDVEEIRDFNKVSDNDLLVVGDYINIPDGEVREVVSAPSASTRVAAAPSTGGWLIKPVSGAIKTQGLHGYNAVDLAAPVGTSVMAAASGTVVTAKNDGGWNGGYGNYVIVKHSNGAQTLYAHFGIGSVLVSPGQWVVQGQVLGYIGMTGKTTGPHTHFEVRGATNPF